MSNSILLFLGFNKTKTYSCDSNNKNMAFPGQRQIDDVEYNMLSASTPVEADHALIVTTITTIFIYTDFIEYVIVNNTQTQMLGYLPVQNTWGNVNYQNFNPTYYVRVKNTKHKTSVYKAVQRA